MARQFNVELILSAKQNASKAVNEVTKQLDALKNAQKGVTEESTKSGIALAQLGEKLKTKGATEDTKKIAEALKQSVIEVNKAKQAYAELQKQNEELSQSLAKSKKATDASNESLNKAKDDIKALAKAEREAVSSTKKLQKAKEALQKAVNSFGDKESKALAKQQEIASKLAAAQDKLAKAQVKKGAKTKSAQATVDRLTKSLSTQQEKLDKLRAANEKATASLSEFASKEAKQEASLKAASAAIAKQKDLIGELAAKRKDAVLTEKELAKEQRAGVNAVKRQTSEIDRSRKAVLEISKAKKDLVVLEKELAAEIARATDPSQRYRKEIEDAKKLEKQLVKLIAREKETFSKDQKAGRFDNALNIVEYTDSLVKKKAQVAALSRELAKLQVQLKNVSFDGQGTKAQKIEIDALDAKANKLASTLGKVRGEFNTLFNEGKILKASNALSRVEDGLNQVAKYSKKAENAVNLLEAALTTANRAGKFNTASELKLANVEYEKQQTLITRLAEHRKRLEATQEKINGLVREEAAGLLSSADAAEKLKKVEASIASEAKKLRQHLAAIERSYDRRITRTKRLVEIEKSYTSQLVETRARLEEVQASANSKRSGGSVNELVEIRQLIEEEARLEGRLLRTAAAQAKVNAEFDRKNVVNLPVGQLSKAAKASRDLASGASLASRAFKKLTGATGAYEKSVTRATAAQRKFLGGTRASLNFSQRLRGQVLSTIAAYAGFFEVYNQIKQVGVATQDLQAIHSSLLAVTSGDSLAANLEYDFVKEQADRLGLSVKELAKGYSSFALSAKNSGKIGAGAAREIFVSFAEIGRALHLPTQQISRINLALEQMASKGTVQLEELKRQLGDAIPGVVGIYAKSMGKTTEEFLKMVKAGDVGADTLLNFARIAKQELGGGLANSLNGLQAAFGRLSNSVFDARIQISDGGLEQKLTSLANSATAFFKTLEGRQTVEAFGESMGMIVDGVKLLLNNLDLLKYAVEAFLSVKLIQFFRILDPKLVKAFTSFKELGAAMKATGSITGALRVAFTSLMGVIAVNPLASLAVAALAAYAAYQYFKKEVKSTNIVLLEHKDRLAEIHKAYNDAEDGPNRLAKAMKNVSLAKLTLDLAQLKPKLKELDDQFKKSIAGIEKSINKGVNFSEFEKDLKDIAKLVTVDYYKGYSGVSKAIDEAVKSAGELSANDREVLANLLDQVKKRYAVKKAIEETSTAIDVANGKIVDGAEATLGVRDAFKDVNLEAVKVGRSFDDLEAAAVSFEEVMNNINTAAGKVKGTVDGIKDVMKAMALGSSQQLLDNFGNISKQSSSFASSTLEGRDGIEAGTNLLIQREGYLRKARLDITKGKESQAVPRGGYGSDTRTDVNGRVTRVKLGEIISRQEAMLDLQRRVRTEVVPTIVKQIGAENYKALNSQQQGVLISNAYNYGSLQKDLVSALKSRDNARVSKALRNQSSHNKGQNSGRRTEEAVLFAGASYNSGQEAVKKNADRRIQEQKDSEKRIQDAAKFREQLDRRLEKASLLKDLEGASTEDKAVAIELYDRELEAKRLGITLTEEDRRKIEETVRLREQGKNVQEGETELQKRAAEAQKRLNNLIKERNELLKQMKLQTEAGDTTGAEQTKQKVEELSQTIAKARAEANGLNAEMAAAGDAGASYLTAKNNTEALAYSLQSGAQSSQFLGVSMDSINETFASGLTGAFDNFATAVANGESASEAARKAFLNFASSFLREISGMIIKQMLLNALQGASGGGGGGGGLGGIVGGLFGGGGGGGGLGGIVAGLFHNGGLVTSTPATTRIVNPSIFAGAQKFHQGGIVGLQPGEVPAVLKTGEQVLPANSPNNILTQAANAQKQGSSNIKVVNSIDAGDFVSEGIASSRGEEVFMNFINSNATAIKGALG